MPISDDYVLYTDFSEHYNTSSWSKLVTAMRTYLTLQIEQIEQHKHVVKDSADKGRIVLAKQEYERIRNMKRAEFEDYRAQVNKRRKARADRDGESESDSSSSGDDDDESEEDFKVKSRRS